MFSPRRLFHYPQQQAIITGIPSLLLLLPRAPPSSNTTALRTVPSLRPSCVLSRSNIHIYIQKAHLSTTVAKMAATAFKLSDISSLKELQPGQKREAAVEGIEGAKVLLTNVGGKIAAVGSKCTHYGAPLVKGALSADGRLTCPWHGGVYSLFLLFKETPWVA